MENKVVLLSTDTFGNGDRQLGETVLESFLTLLKQEDTLPAAIFCMNRGVFTLTNQSLASLHMQELYAQGVPIYACKTCVDYYALENELVVGEISNMARFVDLAAAHPVLTIA
ncbi:DsrE family protein [Numidum massiliense]|uniref:DsrE family protein n=1 Tax=Numidum massiliense TaxID=1522315 RepID=UPI0006D54232|nr:DsrE family protein [Numidum massiliense]